MTNEMSARDKAAQLLSFVNGDIIEAIDLATLGMHLSVELNDMTMNDYWRQVRREIRNTIRK